MRDVTKSMLSFSWAMSLFGVQQTLNLLSPGKATVALDKVKNAAEGELGETLKSTFKAGDNLQRGVMDLTFGVFSGQSVNPSRWIRMSSDVMQQSAQAVGQGMRAAASGFQSSAASSSQQSSGRGPTPSQPDASGSTKK